MKSGPSVRRWSTLQYTCNGTLLKDNVSQCLKLNHVLDRLCSYEAVHKDGLIIVLESS